MSWVPVAAVAVLVAVGAPVSAQPGWVAAGGAVLAVAAAAAVRPATSWRIVPGLTVSALGVGLVASGSAGNVAWFGTCILAAWCALAAGLAPALTLTALLLGGFLAESIVFRDQGWFPWLTGVTFTVVMCLMARRQIELVERLRAAQAGLAENAATEERTRIARELHDVIGHALTVSLLHVTSARLALHEDLAEAEHALAEAERLGQQSLAEVRHAVGVLRDTGSSGRVPLPGAAQLDELVEGFSRAGAQLEWQVRGDPASLSATTGLTLYRILQEALTNVARHGSGSPATAQLSIDGSSTLLMVDSAGPAAGAGAGGVGLLGMRERAEALGGTLTAGPTDAGWRVQAVLPT